jgi:hypothetical protein
VSDEDSISTSITRTVGELIKDPAKELSALVTDHIKYYRWRSLVRISERAKEIRKARGLDSNSVPIKLLIPLLEEGSKEEEDSEMIEIWARLLASADTGMTSFDLICIEILGKLTSREAAIVQAIGSQGGSKGFHHSLSFALDGGAGKLSHAVNTSSEGLLRVNEKGLGALEELLHYLRSEPAVFTWRRIRIPVSSEERVVFQGHSQSEYCECEESIFALKRMGLIEDLSILFTIYKDMNNQYEIRQRRGDAKRSRMRSQSGKQEAIALDATVYEFTEIGDLLWKKIGASEEGVPG